MPGHPASATPWTADLTSGRLVVGIGADVRQTALRLGLDPEQFGWGGDDALHAELDCPPGSWRIWPARNMALWLSERPNVAPPPTPVGGALPLNRLIRVMRRRGVRARELRLFDGEEWSAVLRVTDALAWLEASEAFGISGVWSSADRRPARIEVFTDGTLWAPRPADAFWWAIEAVADD